MAILYGDGIHDDYEAIQELLDSGSCQISLPAPKKLYSISKTLKTATVTSPSKAVFGIITTRARDPTPSTIPIPIIPTTSASCSSSTTSRTSASPT